MLIGFLSECGFGVALGECAGSITTLIIICVPSFVCCGACMSRALWRGEVSLMSVGLNAEFIF